MKISGKKLFNEEPSMKLTTMKALNLSDRYFETYKCLVKIGSLNKSKFLSRVLWKRKRTQQPNHV